MNRSTNLIAAALVLCACSKTLQLDDGAKNGDALGNSGRAADEPSGHAGASGAAGAATSGASGIAGEVSDEAAPAGGEGGATDVGGGGGGDQGDGWGGSLSDALLAMSRWTGNDEACPSEVPEHGSACALEEGEICAYHYHQTPTQSDYAECACRMHCDPTTPTLKWDCYRNTGSWLMECPEQQPENGSSCFGLKGNWCSYPPYVTCTCPTDPNDSDWRCVAEVPPQREHPSGIDPDKRIADLSDAERAAWCAWYAPPPPPGFPAPPVLPVDADGFYPDTGCAWGVTLGCSAQIPGALPQAACEANLALSSCEATVEELSACYLTATSGYPAPFGCARYFAQPGCSGTIVISAGTDEPQIMPGWMGCRLKVE